MVPETAPDAKYPNTYSNFCEIDTLKVDRYRQHLKALHDIDLEISGMCSTSDKIVPRELMIIYQMNWMTLLRLQSSLIPMILIFIVLLVKHFFLIM